MSYLQLYCGLPVRKEEEHAVMHLRHLHRIFNVNKFKMGYRTQLMFIKRYFFSVSEKVHGSRIDIGSIDDGDFWRLTDGDSWLNQLSVEPPFIALSRQDRTGQHRTVYNGILGNGLYAILVPAG